MNFSLAAPFTAIHAAFDLAFTTGLNVMVNRIETAVDAPLAACVTLWIIIQGILVMRGEVETRSSLTRVVMVTIVVGLIEQQGEYESFVAAFFEQTIPAFVQQFTGSGLPLESVPSQLDGIFAITQGAFEKIASEVGPLNAQDTLALQGAQWTFYGTLWGTFGIFDAVNILTKVLVTIGPLVLVGQLFERTRDLTAKWIGQLITYSILLFLLNIVATIVVATEAAVLTAMLAVVTVAGTTAAKIIGLYELDMFFLTGDALIVALPAIAGNIGGSYWSGGASQPAGSFTRRSASKLRRGARHP